MNSVLLTLLALALTMASALVCGAGPGDALAAEDKKPQKTPSGSGEEIIFQGKLYASLTRNVPIPYQGIISDLPVRAGQQVKRGDVLVRLKLAPQVIANLRRVLYPPQIQDLEIQIVKVASEIMPLRAQYREIEQLVSQQMGAVQKKQQIAQTIEALERQQQALQKHLDLQRKSVQDELNALREKLGDELSYDRIPTEVSLKAPIDGHIMMIFPHIRLNAEVDAGPGLIIGVMDPMIVRANIFEIEASRIVPGDKADVSVASIPDKTFEGTVTRINWSTANPGLGQPSYYEIELVAPNRDFILKEGYKTQVTMRRK